MTAPGPSLQTVEWFRYHDVAAVAVDHGTFEVFPSEVDTMPLPVHLLHLVDMGMTQGQHWDLEELAARLCRRRSVHLPPVGVAGARRDGRRLAGQPGRREVDDGRGRLVDPSAAMRWRVRLADDGRVSPDCRQLRRDHRAGRFRLASALRSEPIRGVRVKRHRLLCLLVAMGLVAAACGRERQLVERAGGRGDRHH